jgi:nucleoid DNA-binding protein
VDELIQQVAQRAGISLEQAALAVAAMVSYLTVRLPSPVVGRIREQLGEARQPRNPETGQGGVK